MPADPHNPQLCMDARMLVANGGTGVSTYAHMLRRAHALLQQAPLLLADRRALDRPAPAPFGRAGRWIRALWPGERKTTSLCDGIFVAPDVFRIAQIYFDVHRCPLPVRIPGPAGIMHWTYPVPLRVTGWANLYTVHDVIPLLHPDLSPIDPHRYGRLLNRLARGATAFVTVSNAAALDIAGTLGTLQLPIINCGQAVDDTLVTGSIPAGLAPRGYLLICGTIERRKNIDVTLAAYRASGSDIPLLVAGPDGWGGADIARDIAATPGALRLPYLSGDAMRAVIAGARALLMPSLTEGFGLPVAEAMALNTPVITSRDGALAETAGEAALLVDPADVAAIADAIRRVVSDEALCRQLTAAGRVNAQRFTLRNFADRLSMAYAGIVAPPA